jgi:apolipoprotein N-acyltransferase
MSVTKKLLYAITSGLLLAIGWPSIGSFFPLLFIALIPILLVERQVFQDFNNGQPTKLFPYVYLSIFIFNALTTWWVWYASAPGSIIAIGLNSLFITIAVQLAHFTRKKLGHFRGDLALIFFWIGWEYFHLDWDLSWTWLTLGNGFANAPFLIQWYEYSGVFGGSLWILLSNIFAVNWISNTQKNQTKLFSKSNLRYAFKWGLVLLIPTILSAYRYFTYEETNDPIEILAIQPNIDPYNEKFGSLSSTEQVQKMFDLAEQKITPNTEFVIFPETAIPKAFDEDLFEDTQEYGIIAHFYSKHPNTQIVIGASTFSVYGPNDTIRPTARISNSGVIYDVCNTAISIAQDSDPEFYHKSKMVPGPEKMPFPELLKPLQDAIFDLGGTTGTLGSQKERSVFTSKHNRKGGPIICYESIYGEFVGEYVNQGAEILFIITNDGWWKDTPGYKQHALYAQLRAIEHRRSIARSANTGTSCFINQKGETSQQTDWWVEDTILGQINANNKITFYSNYGDLLGRISLAFGALLLVMAISRGLINKE